ncbi:DUF2318 domain-containing protein [Candidatus Woesearchaeota archaeon]|jgi:uncharacterized membrane protein|nr:DUF2318 domain-containing protein [Candidatus Woesearchaeota archaeon]MBT4110425.1 DUF2318 domain-containing protein [Candidatus Woesearchaeota archaeon]MBT4336051.1 DUF2318 domain-containing protein [Candidatus Woesearchaeota archaeon]MBT4468970.1 DUF2318 domain-containing protein [Candidatus Woesearchaeota archaeon]MBT6744711.1 DUF2318 domain-containing protein [Candidatus Woesearchaeota archaeon]
MKKTIMILGLILITALFIVGCSNDDTNNKEPTTATTSEGLVEIPLDSITNSVQKFDYNANGVTVTYFAVRGSDGNVRTAFDACDVCGGNKGYKQQGTDIACINCGKVFKIDGLGTQNKGYGCWPSYLSHTIENGNIMIKTAELEQGAFRFA